MTEEANAWGILRIGDDVFPIGYAEIGLKPEAVVLDQTVAIGINEFVVGIDRDGGDIAFRYRMPTVFHEFLAVDDRGFLLKDEIGFVWLSRAGEECWSCAFDLIDRFEIEGNAITGRTFEGRAFDLEIPGY